MEIAKQIVKKVEKGVEEDVGSEGKRTKIWGWKGRGGDKKLGRQNSRFEKSMRVLEWLDADCGTKLTQHYEKAGGWRSLPQRKMRQMTLQKPQRRQLRLTRSHLVLGTDTSREYSKVAEDSSSEDEEEEEEDKPVLEDSEDFLNDGEDYDEDDLVLALRGLQEEVILVEDQIDEISMKEYVTSSDDDNKDDEDESDSEDELVLALKAWKDEQLRQERLQQQLQKHRQNSMATQPPALTPVLEDKVSSPTSEAFGYFYQDHRSLVHNSHKEHQNTNHQQHSSATPYWWGGISSVREGPSSPPMLGNHSEFGRSSNILISPRFETSSKTRDTGCGFSTPIFPDPEKFSSNIPGNIPFLIVTTAITTSAVQGSVCSLNTPLSPFTSSLATSPRTDNPSWSFNRAKSPLSPAVVDTGFLDAKGPYSGYKNSEYALKNDIGATSPRTPLGNKSSSGGFGVFSSWLGSASNEKQATFPSNADAGSDARVVDVRTRQAHHITVCTSLSTASSDSGIERSPGYLSPAPRSAGIEKIGDFFRRFHHKLSSSSSSSSTKTTPPATPLKLLQQQPPKNTPRRLSLSTSSIPSSSLLKPTSSSPIAKFAATHAKCAITKSDPLATGVLSKHSDNQWLIGQHPKGKFTHDSPGPLITSSRLQIDNTRNQFETAGQATKLVAVGSVNYSKTLTVNGGLDPTGITRCDRESNIDTLDTSRVHELKSGNASPFTCGGVSEQLVTVHGRDTQLFAGNQHSFDIKSLTPGSHPILAAKRSTGETTKTSAIQDLSETCITESESHSSSKFNPKDKYNSLTKSNEAFDVGITDDNTTCGNSSSYFSGFSKITKVATQILRKSPVCETDYSPQVNSVEQGKSRTFQSEVGVVVCGGLDNGEVDSVNLLTRIEGEGKGNIVSQKDEIMCSEISPSVMSDERGTLSVPTSMQERGRRGSHGSCNFLFLEQASGRKSPKPAKGRTSPSPVRGSFFKTAVNSTSTSSSSSAESSSKIHHQIISRVQSLPSPSSPPPHHIPKTSPKHLPNLNQSESPTKSVTISDGSPTNYHGRRKFSDTGLTPVPRRLFNDGRRGSLTDERILVSAKSKLGKLRTQGRKSSDAGSVAALVKQIHNLWGDKDEEIGQFLQRRESDGSLKCSVDDQVLFDKRRKRFSLSIGRHKDNAFGIDEKKASKNIAATSEAPKENEQQGRSGGLGNAADSKVKKKPQKKSTHLSLISLNTLTPSSTDRKNTSSTTDDIGCSNLGKICSDDVSFKKEVTIEDGINSSPAASSCSTVGSCSEFIAPIAHVVSRQLVATAMSSAAPLVGMDTSDSFLSRATIGSSLTNIPGHSSTTITPKSGRKTPTVQFQPIVSWDDNIVGGKVSPGLRSVLKSGARRHSSFAGFSESTDDLSVSQHDTSNNSVFNKQAKNALPKSKTSDNYKGILKQTDRPTLTNTDLVASPTVDKKRAKSPSPKSKKNEEEASQNADSKSTETSLTLCMKATRSVSPKTKKNRNEAKECQQTTEEISQLVGISTADPEQVIDSENHSAHLITKTVGIQATPRMVGKTSNTGTQTSDQPEDEENSSEFHISSSDSSGWLQRLAAKCIASVGSTGRPCAPGLPRAASVRAEWLLGNKRMGSGPNSPVATHMDPSGRFWVPHEVIARKRAQSLVPTLSKSEDDLTSEELTPSSVSHPRDLAFVFPNERSIGGGIPPDGQPSTPTSGYNLNRRRASMHDAIDLTKIDTRLYDKKLVRQASVTSIDEESQGTIHISLEHNSETNILTINLVRAHNLLPRDAEGTANPYCRLTLLPAQRTSAQCRIHRKTLNPIFEEEFIFEVTSEEVASSTLEVSVFEYDQFSTDECVGFVRIRLSEFDLSKQVDLWRCISPYDKPKDQKVFGDVMFSISYLPSAERLTVVVVKARNLRLSEDNKDINPFIKVCVTSGSKKLKKKKTSAVHCTNSPTWNEALVFSVHKEKLGSIGLEISAFHENKLGVDECIGRVRLLPDCDDGMNCQDLLSEKGMPTKWYTLS